MSFQFRAAAIDDPVGLLQLQDIFGGEAGPSKADGVQPHDMAAQAVEGDERAARPC